MEWPNTYRRVLVVATEPNSPHFETSLEIAARFAQQGSVVHHEFIYPIYHEFMRVPDARHVRRWVRTGQEIAKKISGPRLSTGWRDLSERGDARSFDATLATFESWNEFRDLGDAVRSSASNRFQSLCVDESLHKEAISDMIVSGILVYEETLLLLKEAKPDLVVFFNGRFVNSRAVWRASETLSIQWASHERGGQDDRYFFEVQTTVHDTAKYRLMVSDYAASLLAESKPFAISPALHAARLQQASQVSWAEYVGPRVDVVYFASSLTEFSATGYEYFGLWGTEQEAFRALAESCRRKGRRIALRLHPNMQRYGECEEIVWQKVLDDCPWAAVIRPDDRMSTYDILESARVIATGFSTVGLEAALRGKPVAVFATAPYAEIVQAVECESVKDIDKFLDDEQMSSKEGAAIYLDFLNELGHGYVFYRATTSYEGHFDGIALRSASRTAGARLMALVRHFGLHLSAILR